MLKYVIVSSICSFLFILENKSIIIKTNQGEIQGRYWKTRQGRTFLGFTGIPYAKPPIGPLRFLAPVPIKSWRNVLDASKNHALCPQVDVYVDDDTVVGNEDCLFLNVYVPQLPKYIKELLPVMFYVHGGSFVSGSGRYDWIGPDVLLDKDIILVTANYRLGALGFLSTGDEWAPGNNGLKDQSLALKWVKRNIVNFGGDSQKITVFGNSAGAACAHYHMISPLSRNLINRAIIQSGSAYSHYAISRTSDAIKNANKLGEFLNCSTETSKNLIECLRKVDAYEIVKQERTFSMFEHDTTIPFRIVVEADRKGAFLIEDPLETIRTGKVANVPFMTGIVTEEGSYKVAEMNRVPAALENLNKYFKDFAMLAFGIESDVENISKTIKTFYFGDRDISNSTQYELTNLLTDGIFLWGVDTTVKLHFKYATRPAYQYLFGYRGSASYTSIVDDSTTYDYGVTHTDELLYLFSLNVLFPKYKPTEADKQMSVLMTTLWTNFAKTGNPTSESDSKIPIKWNPVENEHLEYYYIKDYHDITMAKDLHQNRTKFWRSLPIRTTIIKHEM